jgi:hypothetical protein
MLSSYALGLWLTGTLVPAPRGNVCACAVPLSVAFSPEAMMRYARQGAYTIVLGTVTAVDTTARDSVPWPDTTSRGRQYLVYPTAVRYTLAVERRWKGPVTWEVTITDYDAGGECGRSYEKGQAYLVYAQKDPRLEDVAGLTTTICSRVMLERDAAADRRVLGRGRALRG